MVPDSYKSSEQKKIFWQPHFSLKPLTKAAAWRTAFIQMLINSADSSTFKLFSFSRILSTNKLERLSLKNYFALLRQIS
jgi:hypothetical protein